MFKMSTPILAVITLERVSSFTVPDTSEFLGGNFIIYFFSPGHMCFSINSICADYFNEFFNS